jgi:hypothetical protein
MPTTPYIEATSFEILDDTVENPENLLSDSDGDANMIDTSEIQLNFPDVSSYIPSNATVTGISVRYTGTPTAMSIILVNSRRLIVNNTSINATQTIELGQDTLYSTQINLPYVYETPTPSSVYDSLVSYDEFYGNNAFTSGILTGDTTFALVIRSFSYESLGYTGAFTLNGDGVPAIQFTYTIPPDPKTKIKIQSNVKVKFTPTTILNSGGVTQGPYDWANVGDVGDGGSYDTPVSSYNNRLLFDPITSTGTFALNGTNMPKGLRLRNFFGNSEEDTIPSNAEIVGVSLLAVSDPDGTGEGYIGSAGPQGNSARFDMECYFYNGTTYSDKLTWDVDNAPDGMTFFSTTGGVNSRARFTGPNVHYKNDTDLRDILFGGENDLSGLSWDPANQANFGFSMIWLAPGGAGTVLASVQRGLTMKVSYQIPSTTGNKILIK